MRTILISLVLVFVGVTGYAQSLTLKIEGIENAQGFLYVGIYDSETSFMKKPVYGFRVDVKDKALIVPCKGLPAGIYAISVFQDENGNGVLDTGSFGRPTEKFGFSNNAEGIMGPPAYKKCVFELKHDAEMELSITLI